MFISTAYAGVGDIVKNDSSLSSYFLSQFENLTPWKIIIGLIMGCLVGLIIAFVYKRCYRGVLYSPTFALTLMMLTLITTPVVMCIKSNISLSMGMVGALSIVRFRTAVKDPMEANRPLIASICPFISGKRKMQTARRNDSTTVQITKTFFF